MLVNGVMIEYQGGDGSIRGKRSQVVGFPRPGNQRLTDSRPVHRPRKPQYPPPLHCAVPQLTSGGMLFRHPDVRSPVTVWHCIVDDGKEGSLIGKSQVHTHFENGTVFRQVRPTFPAVILFSKNQVGIAFHQLNPPFAIFLRILRQTSLGRHRPAKSD